MDHGLYIVTFIFVILILVTYATKVNDGMDNYLKTISDNNRSFEPAPKKIYTYWNNNDVPDFIKKCVANWKRMNPDYEVILVVPSNLDNYVNKNSLPENFDILTPQRQSDWIRLYLIKNYGGTWLDASIILTKPLSDLEEIQRINDSEGLGFYLPSSSRYTPHIETWFIMAKPGQKFISAWFTEFDKVCRKYGNDGASYLGHLQKTYSNDLYHKMVSNRYNPAYLTVYVVSQKLMLIDDLVPYHLESSDKYGFYYQNEVYGWNHVDHLFIDNKDRYIPSMIKLINKERKMVIEYIEDENPIDPNSIYAKFIE